MFNYEQPSFYRFSQDSTFLAKYAFRYSKAELTYSILDLCAGCGVIGIEYCLQRKKADNLISIELQAHFEMALSENLKRLGEYNFLDDYSYKILDFNELSEAKKFDIILCNPPYYSEASSRLPKDLRRRFCRHRNETFLKNLLLKAQGLLANKGEFFLCLPEIEYQNNMDMIHKLFFIKEMQKELGVLFLRLFKLKVNRT